MSLLKASDRLLVLCSTSPTKLTLSAHALLLYVLEVHLPRSNPQALHSLGYDELVSIVQATLLRASAVHLGSHVRGDSSEHHISVMDYYMRAVVYSGANSATPHTLLS